MSRRWTSEDTAELSAAIRHGRCLTALALMLKRRKADVTARAKEMQAAGVRGPGYRKCLDCGRAFHSRGAHNRLCLECRARAS